MANCKKCGRSAGLFRFICTSCERTLANEERLKDTPKFDAQNVYPDSPEAESAEEIINALSPKPEQEAVEPIEKTTAQKVGKGCAVLIVAVVLGAFMLLNGIGSALDSFQDNVGCRVSSGNCK